MNISGKLVNTEFANWNMARSLSSVRQGKNMYYWAMLESSCADGKSTHVELVDTLRKREVHVIGSEVSPINHESHEFGDCTPAFVIDHKQAKNNHLCRLNILACFYVCFVCLSCC